uniref:Uncharacterized protein n=1 Tax=Anguilla anguilla TaxID=7936 RepID=A0A0E9UW62_ANGAN
MLQCSRSMCRLLVLSRSMATQAHTHIQSHTHMTTQAHTHIRSLTRRQYRSPFT